MTTTETSTSPSGPWMKYRAQYSKLPPAVQMIGLQLWLPVVFVVAFGLCYINAFHHPSPHDVKIAVVGSGSQTEALAQGLQSSSDGVLKVSVTASAASAVDDVRTGDLAGVFTPGTAGTPAKLTISSGTQYQLAEMTQVTLTKVAAAEKTTLAVTDLKPLPSRDSYGTVAFYLALLWTIAGYMVGMFVGMMGAPLRHWVRLAIIAGSGLVLSGIATLMVGPIVGAISGHFLALWLTGWATTIAIGLVVNGLAYFVGRFVTGFALILFVFLNIPSSGGAFPPEFVPGFFSGIHPFVAGTGVIDVIRSIVYDAGPGIGSGALVLACYALAGVVLSLVGKPFFERRARIRKERGKPQSMMLDAQGAAIRARHAEEAAAAELAKGEAAPPDNAYADEEAEGDAATAGAAGVSTAAAGGA